MFKNIIKRLKAVKFWLSDMFVFWAPVEHSHYDVRCPQGHMTRMTREDVLQLSFTESQITMIDWDYADSKIVHIRYTECPHPDCQAEWKRHQELIYG